MQNNTQQKITAWAAAFHGDTSKIVAVSVENREEAVVKLESCGYRVVDPSHVKPVTIIPGHDLDGEEVDWENAEIIQERHGG